MSWVLALGIVLRASFLLALSLVVLPALRGGSASLRRWVVLLGLGASLAVPLLPWAFPNRPAVHVTSTAVVGRVVAEALSPDVSPVPAYRNEHAGALPTSFSVSPSAALLSIWA